jgi:primosomal protein N'
MNEEIITCKSCGVLLDLNYVKTYRCKNVCSWEEIFWTCPVCKSENEE